jgi:molybdopterin guanine dinucleotide-containing S/N-oxide reductase-like protein
MPEPRTVHTVCSHDCPDSCAVLVTVDELGKATRVQGDPAHPVTRGFLCGKVAKYLDRVYSPSRLLYPMRRREGAPKGRMPDGREADVFERIGWDQALDLIAERLRLISEEYGPESILPYSYAGTIGLLGFGSMDRRFFHRLGASRLDRTICSTTGGDALVSVYGKKLGTDTEHFRHSRYIIAWGANIHGNNVHLWPFVEEARRHGAKLVVIDPYRTRTAKTADWHIPIQPGTDAALALGLMRILIEEGLYDRDYVAEHTHGFEALRDHVQPYTPEHVAGLTGVAAADVERLAREYAANVPAVIRMNYGIQRSQNGGAAARAVCMLPALIGAWKHLGGGLQLSTSGAFAFNNAALERPDLMLASPLQRPARIVNMSRLGHALTELGAAQTEGQADGPPVKALFVYNSNPAAIAPNQNAVVRGLMRSDLFTVVHEQFFTDTTDYADIVLPATTFLEHKDIQGAYGHYYVQMSEQAIAPLGEARSNVWLFGQLGQRMGFAEPCFRDTVDDLIDQGLTPQPRANGAPAADPTRDGITRERLEAEKSIRLQFAAERKGGFFLPFANGGFATPSGKAEFYSSTLAAQGLEPLPAFHPPDESRQGADSHAFPLEFLPRKADNYMNSTFANLPGHQKMESPGLVAMHASDASARQIRDADWVEVYNARGKILLRAHIDGSVTPGVVAASLNWNKLSRGGSNVNALTSERLTDLGRGPTFYSTLVEVRKLTPDEAQNLFPPID